MASSKTCVSRLLRCLFSPSSCARSRRPVVVVLGRQELDADCSRRPASRRRSAADRARTRCARRWAARRLDARDLHEGPQAGIVGLCEARRDRRRVRTRFSESAGRCRPRSRRRRGRGSRRPCGRGPSPLAPAPPSPCRRRRPRPGACMDRIESLRLGSTTARASGRLVLRLVVVGDDDVDAQTFAKFDLRRDP